MSLRRATGCSIKSCVFQLTYIHKLFQGCGSGSGVFAWIRISNISGYGSGFQISLDPEPDPVSAQILEPKDYRKVSKSDLSEENLKL